MILSPNRLNTTITFCQVLRARSRQPKSASLCLQSSITSKQIENEQIQSRSFNKAQVTISSSFSNSPELSAESMGLFAEDDFDNKNSRIVNQQDLYTLDFNTVPVDYVKYGVYFTIHFLYYNILGPFIAIFFLFTKRTRYLMVNMHIIRNSWHCLTNTLPWMATSMVVLFSVFTKFKNDAYYAFIYNMVTISCLKCAIIANKYSTMSHEKLEQYKMRIITDDEMSGEHMLESWAEQNPAQIFKHLNTSMIRNQIEDSVFYVSFMVPLNETLAQELREAEEEEAQYNSNLQTSRETDLDELNERLSKFEYDKNGMFKLKCPSRNVFQYKKEGGGTNTVQYFRAKTVLFYLIKKSNQNNLSKYAKFISIAIGVLRGYVPQFAYLEHWNLFPGKNLMEKVILLFLNVALIHLYMYITRFILQLVIDYRRKTFIMHCLKSLISPHKVYKKKIFPTLNILDMTTANSWYLMRKTIQNYGYTMDMRHKLLIPALFFYMIFIYALNWIKNLGLVKLEKTIVTRMAPFLNIDYTIFSWLILALLFELAALNMQD